MSRVLKKAGGGQMTNWLILAVGAPVMIVVSLLVGRQLAHVMVKDNRSPVAAPMAQDPAPLEGDPEELPPGEDEAFKVVGVSEPLGEEDPREAARRAIEEARDKQGPLTPPKVAESQDELDPSVFDKDGKKKDGEETPDAEDPNGLDRSSPVPLTKGTQDGDFPSSTLTVTGKKKEIPTEELVDSDASNTPSFLGDPTGPRNNGSSPPPPLETPPPKDEPSWNSTPPVKDVPTPTPKTGGYTVQVASFQNKDSANALRSELGNLGYRANVVQEKVGDVQVFKVKVGAFSNRESADETARKLQMQNYPGFVQEQ